MAANPLLERAARVVARNPVGMLITVDETGRPHARWMGATTSHGLARLRTLTARGSRKLNEIRANGRVTWVFTSPDFGHVVTLEGEATIIDDPRVLAEAWDSLRDIGRSYPIGPLSGDDLEMTVIETVVTRCEVRCSEVDDARPREVAVA